MNPDALIDSLMVDFSETRGSGTACFKPTEVGCLKNKEVLT